MKKLKLAAMVLSAAILAPAASAYAVETKDVTMAFCTWTGYAPMFIAKVLGYFEEQRSVFGYCPGS